MSFLFDLLFSASTILLLPVYFKLNNSRLYEQRNVFSIRMSNFQCRLKEKLTGPGRRVANDRFHGIPKQYSLSMKSIHLALMLNDGGYI